MITAHAPMGYILGRRFSTSRVVFWAALIGSIFPDLDLIWFYFIDERAVHHHRYWVHIPAFWGLLSLVILPALRRFARHLFAPAVAFVLAVLVHICLDTIAGDVLWGWPFSDHFTHFITVPARFDAWILNFVLHPIFALELAIWGLALYLWKYT